jgi:hypothetical protein
MFEETTLKTEKPPVPRRWVNSITWTTLIGLGFVVYELTSQPGLGVAILCIKFGINDFSTALWLRRIDANVKRGRTCFWLYAATGLWKIAITGTILMFTVATVNGALNRAPAAKGAGQPPDAFIGAMLSAFFGFQLSMMASITAFFTAWMRGIKLWYSSAMHFARRRKIWPSYHPQPGSNRVGRLVLTAFIGLATLAIISLSAMVLAQPNRGLSLIWSSSLMGMMFGGAVGILSLWDLIRRNMLAACPFDCWGEEEWSAKYLPAISDPLDTYHTQ